MRQILTRAATAALAALAAAALADPEPASAGRTLVMGEKGVRAYDEPALDDRTTPLKPPPGGSGSAGRTGGGETAPGAPRGAIRGSAVDPVRRAVERAYLAGTIASADRSRYRRGYHDALGAYRSLGGQRRRELGYVIATLERIARAGRLNAGRMPALFLTLERNRQWWSRRGAPAPGERVRFAPSLVIFQYYPGRGLQLQPLANFGVANGYWQGHRDGELRSLLDELIALRVSRGPFTAWEYYFDFGGGSPPWISGMAQATAMQALARAGDRFDDDQYLAAARRALGAFERRTPTGVRVPAGSGAWYALYSFAPKLQVLNGMLQSLIGLNAYRSLARDEHARELFEEGDRAARARIGGYDTGAWSLYSRSPGRPGPEADLNYHRLNRDFARTLCRITEAEQYCQAAGNFTRYLGEDPGLRPFGPAPAPAVGGHGVKFYFTLSKIGRVGITVSRPVADGVAARTYLSTSARLPRGRHFFHWPSVPRPRREHTYEYRLSATDLAGNTGSEQGTVRVKPPG